MTGCSLGASSLAVGAATTHGGAVSEHAMSAHYALQGDGFGSALERESIRLIERALSSALEASGAGELDGDEFGGGEAVLYVYGVDADRKFRTAEVILRSCSLRPAHVVLRYGKADDPAARELRIDL
jgi:hypothetical protein